MASSDAEQELIDGVLDGRDQEEMEALIRALKDRSDWFRESLYNAKKRCGQRWTKAQVLDYLNEAIRTAQPLRYLFNWHLKADSDG